LDLKRKHRAIIRGDILARGISVSGLEGQSHRVMSHPSQTDWKGFKNGSEVARTSATLPDAQLGFGLNIVFDEAVPLKGHEVVGALNEFACSAQAIIDLF
jgi:hypothetical protein